MDKLSINNEFVESSSNHYNKNINSLTQQLRRPFCTSNEVWIPKYGPPTFDEILGALL